MEYFIRGQQLQILTHVELWKNLETSATYGYQKVLAKNTEKIHTLKTVSDLAQNIFCCLE